MIDFINMESWLLTLISILPILIIGSILTILIIRLLMKNKVVPIDYKPPIMHFDDIGYTLKKENNIQTHSTKIKTRPKFEPPELDT